MSAGSPRDTTPFGEFLWADFLRRRISRKSLEADFEKAIETALSLEKSQDAIYLPGWCGPAQDKAWTQRAATALLTQAKRMQDSWLEQAAR
jgi:hypothetical protein